MLMVVGDYPVVETITMSQIQAEDSVQVDQLQTSFKLNFKILVPSYIQKAGDISVTAIFFYFQPNFRLITQNLKPDLKKN